MLSEISQARKGKCHGAHFCMWKLKKLLSEAEIKGMVTRDWETGVAEGQGRGEDGSGYSCMAGTVTVDNSREGFESSQHKERTII